MMLSIGDLAASFSNRLSNVRIRNEMNSLAAELASGRKSDIRTPLSGDVSPVAVIERTLSNLSAFDTVVSETTLFLGAAQSALSKVAEGLRALSGSSIDMDKTDNPLLIANFGADAASRFDSLVNTLNTGIGGRSLFAGNDTEARPVADAAEILDDIVAGLPPGAVAADISDAVDAYFSPGSGFDTARYHGATSAMAAFRVSPDDALSYGVTAQTGELRSAMAATAKAAILSRGVLNGHVGEQRALIRQTGLDLFAADAQIVALRGTVGILEQRLDSAKTRNSAEATMLRIARSDLVGAEPFETATRLQSVQTQLESFYAVTARLSQLSLSRYLR